MADKHTLEKDLTLLGVDLGWTRRTMSQNMRDIEDARSKLDEVKDEVKDEVTEAIKDEDMMRSKMRSQFMTWPLIIESYY